MANQKLSTKNWKSNLDETFNYMKTETVAIAHELGIEQEHMTSWKQMPELIKSFTRKNATPVAFIRNLDTATYSLREKLRWTSRMAGCLAIQKLKESSQYGTLDKMAKKCLYPAKPSEDITHTPEARS